MVEGVSGLGRGVHKIRIADLERLFVFGWKGVLVVFLLWSVPKAREHFYS